LRQEPRSRVPRREPGNEENPNADYGDARDDAKARRGDAEQRFEPGRGSCTIVRPRGSRILAHSGSERDCIRLGRNDSRFERTVILNPTLGLRRNPFAPSRHRVRYCCPSRNVLGKVDTCLLIANRHGYSSIEIPAEAALLPRRLHFRGGPSAEAAPLLREHERTGHYNRSL